ncbi:MAG: LytTR family DNA-binding domain-containing protein [Sulfitobacter sp.]
MPVRTRFHGRLKPELGQVVSLSMQDHYVEVTCENGTDLILMRLSDAIAELDGLKGLRTHRSHWVALEAVKGVERNGAKLKVILKGGRVLPVSATYADHVIAVTPDD